MTVQQIIESLQQEKQNGIASRFPCRAIMVNNIQQYVDLISKLHEISDIEDVSSAELFSSTDVMPKYENLTNPKYQDKWLILTGVSEYLRLFSKTEASNARFSKLWHNQVDAQSKGRIIIPLWGCESQWHDPALHLCDDIRQSDHYYNCIDDHSEDSVLDVLVLSPDFEENLMSLDSQKRLVHIGLQEWFEYWQAPHADTCDLLLLTRQHAKIQPTLGSVTIQVIQNRLAFVRENLVGGHALTKDNCSESAASLLFEYALKGDSVDAAILSVLNVVSFSGTDLMGQWCGMTDSKKQLIALWYQLHPDQTYLCHCFHQETSLEKLPQLILHGVFALRLAHPEWVDEHRMLIAALNIDKDAAYFNELDKMPNYYERLKYLTSKSKAERVYLLHMIGQWMRQDTAQVLGCSELEKCYPALYAYLNDTSCEMDAGLKGYFARYKSYKLANTLPADEDVYFAGADTELVDTRYSKLSNAVDMDSIVLWIDALGAEWLPLLLWTLKTNCNDAKVQQAEIALATLPTETSFNDQWNQMDAPHKKLDKFDKLAHRGIIDDPDYYACIEDQISFIAGIAAEVDELLSNYRRVIITGDHGTSRLAARFFHTREGISVTKGITVYSHGRFCEITNGVSVISSHLVPVKCDGEVKYQVFGNYDHFAQSGFAAGAEDDNAIYGEVHGGATPEEMLVPVVVIDSTKEQPLSALWEKHDVKIMLKKAKAVLCFNRPVQTLVAKIDSIDATCICNADRRKWTVTFAGIKDGTYPVTVVADGKIVSVQQLTIKPALGGGDGDLP